MNPLHRLGNGRKRFQSSVKPQSLAAQALAADPSSREAPSRSAGARALPGGALGAQHLWGTSRDVQEGAVLKSYEKDRMDVGQPPPSMLRFYAKMGTERGHPGLTLLVHASCTLSNSPAPLHTFSDGDLAFWSRSLFPLAPLSPWCCLCPQEAHRTRLCPLPAENPAGT